MERARTELLARNMNNERAVPTRAARRLASIEPTLLFLPGLDGCIPKPSLKTDTPLPPRPRLLQLGEPVSTLCCSRGVTVTDDESSTVFIAVGGRRGGVAIGSVAHRPNPRYVDEDDDDEVIACLTDTIYPTTSSQIVSLCIGSRRRRLCAIDGSGLIRVWRFDLSPTLQIKSLERETRFDVHALQARCRMMQLPRFVRIDDDDELREAGWKPNLRRLARWREGSTPSTRCHDLAHWLISTQVRRRGRLDPPRRRAALVGHGLAWHWLSVAVPAGAAPPAPEKRMVLAEETCCSGAERSRRRVGITPRRGGKAPVLLYECVCRSAGAGECVARLF